MRMLASIGVLAVVAVLLADTARPRAAACEPAGNVRFICDQVVPEDLFLVPGRAPERIWLNSVVGLLDGGFVVTNFSPIGQAPDLRARIMAGTNNGELWEWHTATGWQRVPESSLPGPNGLEISADGRWLYVGAWGSESVVRLSRGQTPVKKESVSVGFSCRQHSVGARRHDARRRPRGHGAVGGVSRRTRELHDDLPGAGALSVQRSVRHGHGGRRGGSRDLSGYLSG